MEHKTIEVRLGQNIDSVICAEVVRRRDGLVAYRGYSAAPVVDYDEFGDGLYVNACDSIGVFNRRTPCYPDKGELNRLGLDWAAKEDRELNTLSEERFDKAYPTLTAMESMPARADASWMSRQLLDRMLKWADESNPEGWPELARLCHPDVTSALHMPEYAAFVPPGFFEAVEIMRRAVGGISARLSAGK